ncbi:MAG: hypothetical protein ACLR7Z_10785 [Bilophila wadsworthia]|uniref:hypothetical protein n=1 Tax=Bilophila wadsworthia TaxID=35833 RepID=UPI0027BA5D2F|nr:hypothetical protein [Bilophila wadsworthia]
MAFSGKLTAANHADVFAKITAFITGDPAVPGRDWTVARHDALEWGPATVFRNTSLSGTEEVYVGLYAATYTDGVKGGLVCKVYKAFDAAPRADGGTDFLDTRYGNGTGQNGTHSFLPCWNAAMNLWIWSNKARVMLVVECNGLYGNAYLGQLRRFSLPSENPWPLACLTDGYTSLWQYTTWHDAITSTGSRDADLHRRNLAFVRRSPTATRRKTKSPPAWTGEPLRPRAFSLPATTGRHSRTFPAYTACWAIPLFFSGSWTIRKRACSRSNRWTPRRCCKVSAACSGGWARSLARVRTFWQTTRSTPPKPAA